jgi:ribosomal protein L37E
VRVIELEDFLCRCGAADFQKTESDGIPVSMSCRRCGRGYAVRKLEKKSRLSGLPMSLGLRSLYWDRFDHSGGSQFGVTEEGWEIREAETPS